MPHYLLHYNIFIVVPTVAGLFCLYYHWDWLIIVVGGFVVNNEEGGGDGRKILNYFSMKIIWDRGNKSNKYSYWLENAVWVEK